MKKQYKKITFQPDEVSHIKAINVTMAGIRYYWFVQLLQSGIDRIHLHGINPGAAIIATFTISESDYNFSGKCRVDMINPTVLYGYSPIETISL